MKRFALPLILTVALALPASAQDKSAPNPELGEGIDLLGRGAELILEGLLAELGPAWAEMVRLLDNINAYHPPEILPNGDIIIRRKQDLLPDAPTQDGDATELQLCAGLDCFSALRLLLNQPRDPGHIAGYGFSADMVCRQPVCRFAEGRIICQTGQT